jgi:hypothetical protein
MASVGFPPAPLLILTVAKSERAGRSPLQTFSAPRQRRQSRWRGMK